MDDREVGRYWEANAPAWTKLARDGWDVYRDVLNTPAFLDLLPEVRNLSGLDIGCGEGHNTRLLARRGAKMAGIDIAPTFVRAAMSWESREPAGIQYALASGQRLPFANAQFDFATAFMSLMDMPDHRRALAEIHRTLRAGGFLQFSITHPCFTPPHRRLLRDEQRNAYAIEVGRYFETGSIRVDRWIFSAAPADARRGLPPFAVPVFHRTLSDWLNTIIETGFVIERVAEPSASAEVARQHPEVADTRIGGYFLHVRCRKPA